MAGSDSFAGRPDLPAGQVAFDTTGASLEAGEDNYTVAGAGSLWWKFTATATDKVTLSATVTAADPSADYIRLTLYVDNGATDAAGAMRAVFSGVFVSTGQTKEIVDLSATAGKVYWISVEGLKATGTVGWTHPTEVLVPGPWITPDVQQRAVACGRRIRQQHRNAYDSTRTLVQITYIQWDEDPRSGPNTGDGVSPWFRCERKAIYQTGTSSPVNQTDLDLCIYVWRPVDFPRVTGPQPPGAVGIEYEALEGFLVPGQKARLHGQIRARLTVSTSGDTSIVPPSDAELGLASPIGYVVRSGGSVDSPTGDYYESSIPPPTNLLEAATATSLMNTSGLSTNDGIRIVDVTLGEFDSNGAIGAYLSPINRTMPSLPETPDDSFGVMQRLEHVGGSDSSTWAPPPISYLYQPPRYRWLFPDLPRPLRQRQRQDGLAISAPRQFTRNRPKSKQISVRAGWEGTYL